MASFGDFVNDKVLPPVLKFVDTKPINALKNGMMVIMPLTIIGALFLLLANFPIDAMVAWEKSVGLWPVFMRIYSATFNLLGLVACIAITYNWVKEEGFTPLPAAVWALCTFVLLSPQSVVPKGTTTMVEDIIPMTWTSSKGMIGGILIAWFLSAIYCWFLRRDIRIKMPAGVPENVANAFTSLIPGSVIMILAAAVYAIFKAFDTTMIEAIYTALQTPLQSVSDSLPGMLLMSFLIPFLWFFGVHGSTIVSGIMTPIAMANASDNQAILNAGKQLTTANGGRIFTQQFLDNYINMTGAGVTIGLVVYMLVFAKSAQFKTLGRLGGAPAAFNINEPITFGTPIVMNPLLAVPFFLVPFLNCLVLYICMATGLVPLFSNVMVPWTTPPILSGLLIGGWRHAILQALILVMAVAVYYPFAKKIDKMYLADELAAAAPADDDATVVEVTEK